MLCYDEDMNETGKPRTMCQTHRAFEASNCPGCGTETKISTAADRHPVPAPAQTDQECPSCGVQLNEDGTVDKLDDESDSHFTDCTATFTVVAYDKAGNTVEELNGPGDRTFNHYGPARDLLRQRRAMSGPRLDWRIE